MSRSYFPLIAAPFTPFTVSGSIDYDKVPLQAEKLIRDGVSGAFICGTTGEGFSLTTKERISLAEAWRRAADGTPLRIIVHVGHNAIEEAQTLARHGAGIGCDAIASIGPSFFTATHAESLVEFFRIIAGATDRPFYYYHMPSMARVRQKASELLPLLKTIPTFRGIKFTHDDVADLVACVRASEGKFEMLFGRDEILLEALRAGAHGAVGSTYNYAAPIYQRLIAAHQAGDAAAAEAFQAKATGFINIFLKYGGLEAGKALMKMCGVDCGPMRLPLAGLKSEAYENLLGELERNGFFEDLRPIREAEPGIAPP